MKTLIPLMVVVPLLSGSLLIVFSHLLPRRVSDSVAILTAAAVAVMGSLLAINATDHAITYWFGGWLPRGGAAIGICFTADVISSSLAAFAGVLFCMAFIFSWNFFESVGTLFHALMLVFLAALAGFSLTGDLFDMFVFFELMSVAAYALTGLKIEESSIEGALNFGITNSIGGFLFLMGIGLVYGRTGALNFAQIGTSLAGRPIDGLITVAFLLMMCGLFVKAAIAPFHFWLDDAHAVAPTPVCIIFSGIMVEIALYALARIYWTMFSGTLGAHAASLTELLMIAGAITAMLGSLLCIVQRHIKRLLAFSTISHSGIILAGVAALDPGGLTGAGMYLLGHGFIKSALFICAGIILHHYSSVDEIDLHGKAKSLVRTRWISLIGGLALASMPPFGMFYGKAWLEDAAAKAGYSWIGPLFIIASALTGAAVLRFTLRVFWGLGPTEGGEESTGPTEQEQPETEAEHHRTPIIMTIPAMLMLAGALALPFIPHIRETIPAAATLFESRHAYTNMVISDAAHKIPNVAPLEVSTKGILFGIASTLLAVAIAALSLFRERIPDSFRKACSKAANPAVDAMQYLHSGHVGDYVTWLVFGVAAFGIAMVVVSR